jgi:hypothetical protein
MVTKKQLQSIQPVLRDLVELLIMSTDEVFSPFGDLEPPVAIDKLRSIAEHTGAVLEFEQPFPIAAPHTFVCTISFAGEEIGNSGHCHTKDTALEQGILNMCYHNNGKFHMAILNTRTKYWQEIKVK